jgi:hypothetical protein
LLIIKLDVDALWACFKANVGLTDHTRLWTFFRVHFHVCLSISFSFTWTVGASLVFAIATFCFILILLLFGIILLLFLEAAYNNDYYDDQHYGNSNTNSYAYLSSIGESIRSTCRDRVVRVSIIVRVVAIRVCVVRDWICVIVRFSIVVRVIRLRSIVWVNAKLECNGLCIRVVEVDHVIASHASCHLSVIGS